jgi:hypothetical protein
VKSLSTFGSNLLIVFIQAKMVALAVHLNRFHIDVLARYYVVIWPNLAILLAELAESKGYNLLN